MDFRSWGLQFSSFRRHSFYFRRHRPGVEIHSSPRQFSFFRRRAANISGLQGFCLWNQAKCRIPASSGLPWASGRGSTRAPGPPRQLASGAWGASFFFRRRSLYFRLLHFPDFRRHTRQFFLQARGQFLPISYCTNTITSPDWVQYV